MGRLESNHKRLSFYVKNLWSKICFQYILKLPFIYDIEWKQSLFAYLCWFTVSVKSDLYFAQTKTYLGKPCMCKNTVRAGVGNSICLAGHIGNTFGLCGPVSVTWDLKLVLNQEKKSFFYSFSKKAEILHYLAN